MTPPGWYPDNENPGLLRYWDGATWTSHVQPNPHQTAQPVAPVISAPNDPVASLASQAAQLRAEVQQLALERDRIRADLVAATDLMMLQEVGIYAYSHPLEDSVQYRERLGVLQDSIASMAKSGEAITGTNKWAVNGSAKDGAKMVADFQKLMLRTYNNEADNVVRTMKPYKLEAGLERIDKVRATIKKLGAIMKVEIADAYHALRVEELQLTADYLAKVADEKEQEREERARLKEEAAARRELEAARAKLEKERSHYATVIQALVAKNDPEALAQAREKQDEIEKAIAGVTARAANTRAGYVYVISNIGAFGRRVVKIGMTRRLEPLDRVRELGDASVPFRFDVHAIVFSDDAVGLETALHRRFATWRVNLVNNHREFFFVKPSEVRAALTELKGDLLSFVEEPEALEWHQSRNIRTGSALPSVAREDDLEELEEAV